MKHSFPIFLSRLIETAGKHLKENVVASLSDIREKAEFSDLFEGQAQHALLAALLYVGATSLLAPTSNAVWGLTSYEWAMWSIWLAITHQVIVAVVFRTQLLFNPWQRLFGTHDIKTWAIVFMPLLLARPFTVLMVGLSDTTSLGVPSSLTVSLGVILLLVAGWALYSTVRFFTLKRALGGDHFREELRALPKVRGGVFNYTDNGMYGVAFLGLWGIALLCQSPTAMAVAFFQHAYIWVHMYTTEQPDMRRMYG
jgi:protein-S-isoprenylcysteine O-methyltransferase Ste14